MSDFTAVFNKHDLSELFVISPPVRNLTAWEPTMVESVIGSVPTGTKPQPMEITLTLTTFAETPEDRLADLRTLSQWLAVDEPKPIVLTDEVLNTVWSGGRLVDEYALRDAYPTGAPKVTPVHNATTADVKFICPDPRAYITQENFFPTSEGGSINDTKNVRGHVWDSPASMQPVTIDGTAPTKPEFYFNGLHGDSSGKFSLKLKYTDERNTQQTKYVTIDAAENASLNVDVDFEKRTLRVGSGGVLRPVFDAQLEWFDLIAGTTYTLEVAAGGFSRISFSYYPRWW